jgi:hypothetical protein
MVWMAQEAPQINQKPQGLGAYKGGETMNSGKGVYIETENKPVRVCFKKKGGGRMCFNATKVVKKPRPGSKEEEP